MSETLFPSPSTRIALDDALTRRLASGLQEVFTGSVVPDLDFAAFRMQLRDFRFEASHPLSEVMDWTVRSLAHGLVHVNHPRYFGLFNPTPSFASECADRIAAAFNPQLATATSSPVGVAIENHVIAAVARRAGLPGNAGGHFTSGGSEANATAALMGLTRACPDYSQRGARSLSGEPVCYVSNDCHLAWVKIAHQLGIGRNAMRLIRTNGRGQMDVDALADEIDSDKREGRLPIMIAATAGTTNAGMVDPLSRCAALARLHDLWFHVDAAWGGGLIASDRLRCRLAGLELADSVTIDAHKWFAATMGCGMFLTRRPALLPLCFDVATSYMPSHILSADPYVTSMQWSRRFLGLRLFLALATVGWAGFAEHVDHSLTLLNRLKQTLIEQNWRIVNDSPVGVLCFVPSDPSSDVKAVVKRVLEFGRAWVSTATFEGRTVIRACVTSGLTTADDITVLVQDLAKAAEQEQRHRA